MVNVNRGDGVEKPGFSDNFSRRMVKSSQKPGFSSRRTLALFAMLQIFDLVVRQCCPAPKTPKVT